MQETVFSKIVRGEIPCHKVWEDDKHLAFLDIDPRTVGHTLVIPKEPIDYVFDMDDQAYLALWEAAKKVAQKLKERLDCKRVCVGVYGYDVAHVHIHLFPSDSLSDVPIPPNDQTAKATLEETARLLAV